MSPAPATIKSLWPLLLVRDIVASVAFYCEKLGFEVAGKAASAEGLLWCRLERGGASFMLQQRDAGTAAGGPPAPTVAFYFVCDDADALFREFTSAGLTLEPPSNAYYGMRQLFVPDPDGYAVCFESPTEAWSG